jgi:MoxR-like ATPase
MPKKKEIVSVFSQNVFAPFASPVYAFGVHRENNMSDTIDLVPVQETKAPMSLQNKFKTLAASAKATFSERDEVVDVSIAALLCRNNVFMLGVPGVAKSAIINYLLSSLKDARGFSILLGAFSTPEQVFGPLDLKALENGRTKTVTKGMLPEADISFVDEIWKASNAILNSLLTILNERKFYDGDTVSQCPLLTCFSASNELPQSAELGALYDRFAFRVVVNRITSATNLTNLLTKSQFVAPPQIFVSELRSAQDQVRAVTVPESVAEKAVEIVMLLRNEGIQISDRNVIRAAADIDPLTGQKALSIIKVAAWLDGRSHCDMTDLTILKHVFWNDPAEASKVATTINKMVDPFAAKYDEFQDNFNQFILDHVTTVKNAKTPSDAVQLQIATNEKVKALIRQIEKVVSGDNTKQTAKLRGLASECTSYIRKSIEAVAKDMSAGIGAGAGGRMAIPKA